MMSTQKGLSLGAGNSGLNWVKNLQNIFINLKAHGSHAIFALRDADDKLINSHTSVLRECHNFYKSLYSAEFIDQVSQEWLLTQLDSSLTLEDQAQCEGELTVFECHEALSQMQSGKSPGSDKFPAEFYPRFWGLLGGDLVDSLNFSFRGGSLSASQRCGILCLLYKKDDPLSLKNWQPISLLNIDCKL